MTLGEYNFQSFFSVLKTEMTDQNGHYEFK